MKLINKINLMIVIVIISLSIDSCANIKPTIANKEISRGIISTNRDLSNTAKDLSTTNTNNINYITDTVTYWITTDKTINVAWDEVTGAVSYNVVLQWVRGTDVLQTYDMGNTEELNVNLILPRAGTFVVGVQGVDVDGIEGEFCYSSDSECSTVDDLSRIWVIEGYLAPATDPVIE